MNTLEDYKEELEKVKAQYDAARTKAAGYDNAAHDVRQIYDRMAADKAVMVKLREDIITGITAYIRDFHGNLQRDNYYKKMVTVEMEYKNIISALDSNMDQLNNVVRDYENQSYHCYGIIGDIRSTINSIQHTIENWTN